MANHCVEVICLNCGRQWCARGCNYSKEPSDEAVERYWQRMREWAERYPDQVPPHAEASVRCECGSDNVVYD